ncbi:MAG: alpha-galactosidase [Geminicoccaceae bacterium]
MEAPEIARLDGSETTMVFAWTEGVPALIYHGACLPDAADLNALSASFIPPLPKAALDVSEPISLHPEAGRGFSGHPALIGHRPDDPKGWAGRFGGTLIEAVEHGVRFEVRDHPRGLILELDCRLDPKTDVATLRTILKNQGSTTFVVDWLAAPVLAPDQCYAEQLSFHGRWCAEFDLVRSPIPMGTVLRENRTGRTSHEYFPGTILLADETSEDAGPCLGAHLGWSGNHRMVLERMTSGDVQLQAGVLFLGQEGAIEPGGMLSTPPLYVARSDRGLNAHSQKFHEHVRRRILRFPEPEKPRPVTVNTWEAIYFDHRRDKLTALVDAAADVGAERFVLDDGWFKGRNDDTTSLGDWYPDPKKYPDGLGPLVDYVHGKQMAFGLWVEPEMVNPCSDLYRAHPEWALGMAGYPMITGRGQLVLDIARPEVSRFLFERIATLVEAHRIDYLKWDMNRNLVLPGGVEGEAVAADQVEALYALIDRLCAHFPSLEIESCASGGARVDYGILARTHRFWPSDSNDAIERMRIQTGFSYFFPPEVIGTHIGPTWSHTSGRGLPLGLRTLVAGFGHMGIEADVTTMSPEERAAIREAIKRHKADRKIWHRGTFSRIRTVDPALIGAVAISEDRMQARLVVIQTDRPRASLPPRIRVKGLLPEQPYRAYIQATSEPLACANRRFDNPIAEQGVILPGEVLAGAGIGLPALFAQTGLAIAIEAMA